MDGIDVALVVWLSLTGASLVYVAWDLVVRTPAMKVMRWGWLLVILYTGPAGLLIYLASCREPRSIPHERYVAPLWKQSVGSTIHCLAGDATGVIAAAAVTGALGLPMGADLVVEYVGGFLFGLLIFQALFTKDMLGGSYVAAVRKTFLPEWVSMNAVMAGMAPVMVILMSREPSAMEPTGVRFWGIMSLATLLGALLAYPVNVWLVARGLKHGMGTVRALGRGGHNLETERASLAALAGPPRRAHLPGADVAAPTSGADAPSGSAGPDAGGEGHGEAGGDGHGDEQSRASTAEILAVILLTSALLAIAVVIAAVFGDLTMSGAHAMASP